NTPICATVISAHLHRRVRRSPCRNWLARTFWCRSRPSPRFDNAGPDITHDGTGWNVGPDSAAPLSFERVWRLSGLIAEVLRAFIDVCTWPMLSKKGLRSRANSDSCMGGGRRFGDDGAA